MKECKWCNKLKTLSAYTKNKREKDGYRRTCRECSTTYERARYQGNPLVRVRQAKGQTDKLYRNRLFLYNYLKYHPCVDCGEPDPIVLEFDHVRGEKKAAISQLVAQCNAIATIQKEIDKCEVRCANCHRRKTSKQFSWYDKTNPPPPSICFQKTGVPCPPLGHTETSPNTRQDIVLVPLERSHKQTHETIQK